MPPKSSDIIHTFFNIVKLIEYNKLMKKVLNIALLLFIILFMLFNSFDVMESIKLSFSICINKLFPSLIPFMLLSNILINYDFVYDISNIFENIMEKVFKVNKNCAFAYVMSILSGTPSNSKYLSDLYSKNLIDIYDIKKCLGFCHFTNPIFVLGTIGYTYLRDKKLGLIILLSHYLGSILIGIFTRGINTKKDNKITPSQGKKNFFKIFNESIVSTTNTLILILGVITTCLIFTCIIDKIINLNNDFKFLYGIIEITQGLNYLALSNINVTIKAVIATAIISFGGICIHMQVFSILDNKKIRYLPYLISRIKHAIISSMLCLIIIKMFY